MLLPAFLPNSTDPVSCCLFHCPCSVDLFSTFYALNPSGDLADTQSTFQDWFSGMRGWQVGARHPYSADKCWCPGMAWWGMCSAGHPVQLAQAPLVLLMLLCTCGSRSLMR